MRKGSSIASGLLAAMLAGSAGVARADEPLFGFVYTTDLLPKGQMEVEQWATWRNQKVDGYFDQVDGPTELSYGLTDRLQLSADANWTWVRAYHDGPFGHTTPPEPLSYDNPGPTTISPHGSSASRARRSIASCPDTSPVGLAIYEEPTVAAAPMTTTSSAAANA